MRNMVNKKNTEKKKAKPNKKEKLLVKKKNNQLKVKNKPKRVAENSHPKRDGEKKAETSEEVVEEAREAVIVVDSEEMKMKKVSKK